MFIGRTGVLLRLILIGVNTNAKERRRVKQDSGDYESIHARLGVEIGAQ